MCSSILLSQKKTFDFVCFNFAAHRHGVHPSPEADRVISGADVDYLRSNQAEWRSLWHALGPDC